MATKKKISPPRMVWVTFYTDGVPSGVTKLAEEAKEWEEGGETVEQYTLIPKKAGK